MCRDIDALNDEMVSAGVGIFVGGLSAASSARSLRAQPDGKVLITDGPYLETKEHIGGFWVLEAADLDEALEWGRKAAVACRAPARCARLIDGGPDGKQLSGSDNTVEETGDRRNVPKFFDEWRLVNVRLAPCFPGLGADSGGLTSGREEQNNVIR